MSTTTRRSFLSTAGAILLTGCGAAADRDEPAGDVTADESGLGGTSCRATTADAEGPYYRRGAPYRAQLAASTEAGERLVVEGRVLSSAGCRTALAGHTVDVWQADANGNYYSTGRLRGRVVSGDDGTFAFETIIPGRYANDEGELRPAHLHVKVFDDWGYELLTTQLYFAGDPYLGRGDFCHREGTCNSGDPARILRLVTGTLRGATAKGANVDLIV